MRALIQRVSQATVQVRAPGDRLEPTGSITAGLVAFIGVTHDDDEAAARKLAERIGHLRVFRDEQGAMNLSCLDVGGGVLAVSQFTLYADTKKGRRPSYVAAARPEQAEPLVDEVVAHLRHLGVPTETGAFGADMEVALVNDGPVTLLLET